MKNKIIILLLLLLLSSASKINTSSYTLDTGHTYFGFDVERFLVGEVTGRFNEFSAKITMNDEDYTSLKIDANIKVNSLDSNNKTRDGHLKGALWLDAEKFPEIQFKSTDVAKKNDGKYMMKGNFTIKGITKEVIFPVEILGPFKDPTQKTAIGIKADFTIDRFDYDIKFNRKMDNGSFFIGNEVKIKIRALAYKDN